MIEYCIGVVLSGGNVVPLCSLPMRRAWAEQQITALNLTDELRYVLMEREPGQWRVSE